MLFFVPDVDALFERNKLVALEDGLIGSLYIESGISKTPLPYCAENKLIRYFCSFYLQTVLPHGKHTLVIMQ